MGLTMTLPSHLSDSDLTAEVARLAGSARQTTADLIAHLAEFDARRLHLAAGFDSLFLYCIEILRLSEHEAYNRIEAARLVRRYPRVLAMLADGALTLTTARLLGPHLADENHEQLLTAASGLSKSGTLKLIARHFPRPDVAFSIRKVPAPRPDTGSRPPERALPADDDTRESAACAAIPVRPASAAGSEPRSAEETGCDSLLLPAAIPPPSRREALRPLAEDRYEIRFTASAATCEKLRAAKDLLRHAVPGGETGEIIDRALTSLLGELAKKKFAATSRPRTGPGNEGSTRHVPAAVKRAVWVRDGGSCAFVGENGRRCEARGFIEYHHVHPYGAGGPPTTGNIELRCRSHNAYEADLFYGAGFDRPTGAGAGRDGHSTAQLVPERVGVSNREGVMTSS
jgi:hypothetical protein